MSTPGSPTGPKASPTALIGHTGFVGSTLARQAVFSHRFNSANIDEAAGLRFDTVVCAAAPGSMLEANTARAADRAKIHALLDQLSRLQADRFILISSIAVLADFAGGDDEGACAFQTDLAYGRHRRELEAFVEDHFADPLIVRLPALFGRGLRKNFLFDLMNPVPSMLKADRLDTQAGLYLHSMQMLERSLRKIPQEAKVSVAGQMLEVTIDGQVTTWQVDQNLVRRIVTRDGEIAARERFLFA